METPSYYAIIPAEVRYCAKLPANAKLLYGEITALTSKEGYCWASSNYFADLYDVSRQTVSGWIKSLETNGFIRCEIEDNYKRRIYLTGCRENMTGVSGKGDRGESEKPDTSTTRQSNTKKGSSAKPGSIENQDELTAHIPLDLLQQMTEVALDQRGTRPNITNTTQKAIQELESRYGPKAVSEAWCDYLSTGGKLNIAFFLEDANIANYVRNERTQVKTVCLSCGAIVKPWEASETECVHCVDVATADQAGAFFEEIRNRTRQRAGTADAP